MAGTEHEFSDEALRAAAFAARAARAARGDNADGHRPVPDRHGPKRGAAGEQRHPRRGAETGSLDGEARRQVSGKHDRKRPRQNDEHPFAGKARRTDETTRRLFDALRQSNAKPICEGGLAHYFITEVHRRADLITQHPNPRAPSALSIPCVFDAVAAASRCESQEGRTAGGTCSVCLQDASSNSFALPCEHAFHTRCIVSWLHMNSSCPCCRAPLPAREPYRYPARTKLQNPLLRDRVEGIRLDMREVALRTSYIEGMQGYEGLLCMYSPALPLDPCPRTPSSGGWESLSLT